MATAEKRIKKPKPTRWYSGDAPLEDLGPVEQVAHRIVQESRYLAPSVDRIMDADLTPSQRLVAINLFSASLVQLDAGHRDPRAAIDAARDSAE